MFACACTYFRPAQQLSICVRVCERIYFERHTRNTCPGCRATDPTGDMMWRDEAVDDDYDVVHVVALRGGRKTKDPPFITAPDAQICGTCCSSMSGSCANTTIHFRQCKYLRLMRPAPLAGPAPLHKISPRSRWRTAALELAGRSSEQ